MKTMAQLAEKIGQTTTTEKPQNTYNHDETVWVKTWRRLLSAKLVNEPVGSSDFKYWRHEMRRFTDADLNKGASEAARFKGFLTLGAFQEMCEPMKIAPCHAAYQALPRMKAQESTRQKYLEQLHKLLGA